MKQKKKHVANPQKINSIKRESMLDRLQKDILIRAKKFHATYMKNIDEQAVRLDYSQLSEASFKEMAMAALYDAIVLFIISVVSIWIHPVFAPFMAFIGMIFYVAITTAQFGGTFGQQARNLVVYDKNENINLDVAKAFKRALLACLGFTLFFSGYFLLLSPKKTTFHDMTCKTRIASKIGRMVQGKSQEHLAIAIWGTVSILWVGVFVIFMLRLNPFAEDFSYLNPSDVPVTPITNTLPEAKTEEDIDPPSTLTTTPTTIPTPSTSSVSAPASTNAPVVSQSPAPVTEAKPARESKKKVSETPMSGYIKKRQFQKAHAYLAYRYPLTSSNHCKEWMKCAHEFYLYGQVERTSVILRELILNPVCKKIHPEAKRRWLHVYKIDG